jgi:rRNA-processing protein FCF1
VLIKLQDATGDKKQRLEEKLGKLQEKHLQIFANGDHLRAKRVPEESNGDKQTKKSKRMQKMCVDGDEMKLHHHKHVNFQQQLFVGGVEGNGDSGMQAQQQKRLDKEEKRKYRELVKAARDMLKKKRSEEKNIISTESFDLAQEGWPVAVQQVFLDGNNMLFVPDYLRTKTLQSGRHSAENALSSLARELGVKLKISTHVMYDSTTTIAASDKFIISSARPRYETSDDALVEIAKHAGPIPNALSSCLFVTSDRGLRLRLKQLGAQVIKPKQWFAYAFQRINAEEETPFEDMSQMLQKFDVK